MANSQKSKPIIAKPMEFRQRRSRPTANPVVSTKPDITLEFTTSKLGIRVRGGDDKMGLYVAAVTAEAPPQARDVADLEGAQIICVNEHNLENTTFDVAVEHFAQLTLPIKVRFRPPLHPPKKSNYSSQHRHHHDHDHHHHHDDDDDEQEGTCYIACYMILFVLAFMFLVSMSLNGWPGIPTAWPDMPRMFPERGSRSRGRRDRGKSGGDASKDALKDSNQKMHAREKPAAASRRELMYDIAGDMNNIDNILDNVNMNMDIDVQIDQDELLKMDE